MRDTLKHLSLGGGMGNLAELREGLKCNSVITNLSFQDYKITVQNIYLEFSGETGSV